MKLVMEIPAETKMTEGLSILLSKTYAAYLKTAEFHWNTSGYFFGEFRNVLEEQYAELAAAVPGIAERIQELGFRSPENYEEFSRLAEFPDSKEFFDAAEMIQSLVRDHEEILRIARIALTAATQAMDRASEELIRSRVYEHEKFVWMLKNLIFEIPVSCKKYF